MNNGRTILLAEDDDLLRKSYELLFTKEGYTIVTVNNGNDALRRGLEGGYSMILLDVMMPHKDGLTVLAELRAATPFQPNGPIVMLTTLSEDKVVQQALTHGALAVIEKSSLTPKQVVDKVTELLS